MSGVASPRRVRVGAAILACVVALLVLWAWWRTYGSDPRLRDALAQRGTVAVWGDDGVSHTGVEGTRFAQTETLPTLHAALDGTDPARVVEAMRSLGVDALLVRPRSGSEPAGGRVGERLARYRTTPGLRGLYLARAAALYALDLGDAFTARDRDALAVVARALVGGAEPPSISAFPESLRAVRPVEVMVLLRSGGRARLWRSARGSSIARALITAATVARKRWAEREQAMGEPLDRALPRLDVEVALLDDDGTVGDRDAEFVDRVFHGEHGVAYERKGAWRYLLPAATRERGNGRASAAYRAFFVEDGLAPESLNRQDLRLYRLRVQVVATSPAPPRSLPPRDGLSDVREPAEVLGP